jgi:hypothetical protein
MEPRELEEKRVETTIALSAGWNPRRRLNDGEEAQ